MGGGGGVVGGVFSGSHFFLSDGGGVVVFFFGGGGGGGVHFCRDRRSSPHIFCPHSPSFPIQFYYTFLSSNIDKNGSTGQLLQYVIQLGMLPFKEVDAAVAAYSVPAYSTPRIICPRSPIDAAPTAGAVHGCINDLLLCYIY